MIARAEFEAWVPFSIERVFRFFANPENLPRIMPPERGTRIERMSLVAPPSPSSSGVGVNSETRAGVGSEIITSFRILPPLPFRTQWIARVTEFEWNDHFSDLQAGGPFKSWHHRHEFASDVRNGVAGTVVRDRIEYLIAYGVLGHIAEKLLIGRQLGDTFAQRQTMLPRLLSEG